MIRRNADTNEGLILSGIDGSNPLGFLAALGTAVTVRTFCPDVLLSWLQDEGKWRPALVGLSSLDRDFLDQLTEALGSLSTEAFTIEKKLPFSAVAFATLVRSATSTRSDRRFVDFVAAFGCESLKDKDIFADTHFRMVRSGDSAGQGFLYYAAAIRQSTDRETLQRTLFREWQYEDGYFSLRWDPIEDSNYALRWGDPAKNDKNTMIGANSLALEALQLLPTAPQANSLQTTGFHSEGRVDYFTWPIWTTPIGTDVIRSLVAFEELHQPQPRRNVLHAIGVDEVFRSRRISPNQYYKNFSPGQAV